MRPARRVLALVLSTVVGSAAWLVAADVSPAAAVTSGGGSPGVVQPMQTAQGVFFDGGGKTGYLIGSTSNNYTGTFAAESTADGGAHWTAANGPAGWQAIYPAPLVIDPTQPSHAYILAMHSSGGSYYGLLETTDSGASWNVETTFGQDNPTELAITSSGRLIALASDTTSTFLMTSDDGGKTWSQGPSLPSSPPGPPGTYAAWNAMAFTDNDHGVLGGTVIQQASNDWSSYRLVTSDGGATWNWQSAGGDFEIANLQSVGGDFFDIDDPGGPSLGQPQESTDGGQTWQSINLPSAPAGAYDPYYFNAFSQSWADPQHGWLLGVDDLGGNVLEYTADGGQDWTRTAMPGVGYGTVAALGDDSVMYGGLDACNRAPMAVTYSGQGGQTPTSTISYGSPAYSDQMIGLDATDSTHAWAGAGCAGMTETTDGTTAKTVDIHDGIANLTGVDFTSPTVGYAAGANAKYSYAESEDGAGIIEKTTDGGQTWTESDVAQNEGFQSVSFGDAQHGWAVGVVAYDPVSGMTIGGIRETTDSGASWNDVSIPRPDSGPRLFDAENVTFPDAQHGWILGAGADANGGFDGVVSRTTDGGSTWATAALPGPTQVSGPNSISFPSNSVGYVIGAAAGGPTDAAIDKSSDGGTSWAAITAPSDAASLSAVSFLSPQIGWVAGQATGPDGDGAVWGTTDGGGTWTRATLPVLTGTVRALKSIPATGQGQPTVWATSLDELTDQNRLLRSTDGGATFTQVSGPAPRGFLSVRGASLTGSGGSGQAITATTTLTNQGDASVTAPTGTTTIPGAQLGGSCLSKLDVGPGQSCTVTITLPNPTEGLTEGMVSLFDNSAGGRNQAAGEQDITAIFTSYGPGGVGQDTVVPTPYDSYGDTAKPSGTIAVDGAGRPWFKDQSNNIAAPASNGQFQSYQVPSGLTPSSVTLVPGKGESMWAIGYEGYAKLGPQDIYGGAPSTPWPDNAQMYLSDPVFGPDGRLWGLDPMNPDQVVAVDLTAGTMHRYSIDSVLPNGFTGDMSTSPSLVVAGSGLAALVHTTATDYSSSGFGIVRIATDGSMSWQGAPAEMAGSDGGGPVALAGAPDGTVYLSAEQVDQTSYQFTGALFSYAVSGDPQRVASLPVVANDPAVLPDGSLWFTSSYAGVTSPTTGNTSVYGRYDLNNGSVAFWPSTAAGIVAEAAGRNGQLFLTGDGLPGGSNAWDLEQVTTGAETHPLEYDNGDLAYYDLANGEFDTATFDGSTVGPASKVGHLVRLNEDVAGLRWSPDGSRLLFARSSPINPNREQGVYTVNPDGTGLTDVTMSTAGNSYDWVFSGQAFSADGSRVLVSRAKGVNAPYSLVSVAADGSGDLKTLLTSSNNSYLDPAASTDGKHLAFVTAHGSNVSQSTGEELDLAAADGSGVTTLATAQTGHSYSSPVFSPDGQTVYYIDSAYDGTAYNDSIDAVSTSGGTPTEISSYAGSSLSDLSVSPDGDSLLFTQFSHGHNRAMISDTAGGSVKQIVANDGDQDLSMPVWQPVPSVTPPSPSGTPTVTELSTSQEYAFPNQGDGYTARVTDGDGNAVSNGQVELFVDGASVDQKSLTSDGTVAFTDTSGRAVGDHSVVARYLGSGGFQPSDSSMQAEAVRHPVAVSLKFPTPVTTESPMKGTVTLTPDGGDSNYEFLGDLTIYVDGQQQAQQMITGFSPVDIDLSGEPWLDQPGQHTIHVEFQASIDDSPDAEYGDSSADTTVTVNYPTTSPPPQLGSVTVTSPHPHALHFTWSKPRGGPVTSYNLTVGGTTVTLGSSATTADFGKGYGQRALTLGRKYVWSLTAINSGGQSGQTGSAIPIAAPSKASSLKVSWKKVRSKYRPTFTWNAPDNTRGRPWSWVAISTDGTQWQSVSTGSEQHVFGASYAAGKKYTFYVRYTGPAGSSVASISSTAG